MPYEFPHATPHGEVTEIFPDIFHVTGSVDMVPGMRISRAMTVLRDRDALTLISPIRLSDDGLAALDTLGKVEHIVKLGGYHLGAQNGLDDPFYVQRYGAKLWALEGMEHKGSLVPDHLLRLDGEFPVPGLSLFTYESSKLPEGMFLLDREGGILITADSLQNWAEPDAYFSEIAAERMGQAGFFKPASIGPEWLRYCAPDSSEFDRVAALNFQHLLPSHGTPMLHRAKEALCETFSTTFGH
ncbi:hypothetical protein [Cognatishimia activa]|uniref:hypothetical protein n=1 Tax=Cognatishimia activa TaxID=1715691 RepID=UPI002230014A|nr:hypothetical protein [Cognatishimia activa]UZD91236.1 hypothetical protein M0D42_01075 [Cognatishimia activa]